MDRASLDDVLVRQNGLASRAQLRLLGLSNAAVRRATARREWRVILPGVVSTGPGELTARQRLVAALLLAGDDAVLASTTAAAWHGVSAASDPRVHVDVPWSRNVRGAGFVVVHRTRWPDLAPWRRPPLVIASRPRAVMDAARRAPGQDAATAVVCEAVQRRLVRLADLRHELDAGPRHGNRQARRALGLAESFVWSVAEADVMALVTRSAALPEPWLNPVVEGSDGTALPTPDLWFDDVALAVQVHSWRWHAGGAEWDATVMSDGVFAEYGVTVIGVTPTAVRTDPARVLRRIEGAYAAAARRERPAVIARRRP